MAGDSDVEDLINDEMLLRKFILVKKEINLWRLLHEHNVGDAVVEDPSRTPPTSFGCASAHHLRKRKAKAQFGRRESRQEDPGKDPEPRIKGCGGR
ncbi:hypothetical protein Tco_0899024 [Tanacetum coccineum]